MEAMLDMDTHNHLKELARFMASYATAMLSAGATTNRIERCVQRITRAHGVDADLSILPKRILITVWDKEHTHNYSLVGQKHTDGINLNTSTLLSHLSLQIEDGMTLEQALARQAEILRQPRINHWLVILMTSVANMSFCQLFGGDLEAMAIVLIATAAGFTYKEKLVQWHWDSKLVVIISSLISALIGTSGFVLGVSATPEIALGTSVLWLVPGIRYINSISDMLRGHYLVAQSRIAEALIITICLSLGLCLALLIANIRWF